MKILGIETSCDETAAAVVENGTKVLSNVIASQIPLHQMTGGVVPEVAAREHVLKIVPVIDEALKKAGVTIEEIDTIAATQGPGLLSSLIIGLSAASSLAMAKNKLFIPVHHISGHIYANWLDLKDEDEIKFPCVVLTVSGGHNELVLMKNHVDFKLLGETLDDAAGEAFDKVARLLGLGYPGGPQISKAAEKGDAKSIVFPKSYIKDGSFDFSFSGLKTAVLNAVMAQHKANGSLTKKFINDCAASFQEAVCEILSDKLLYAADHFQAQQVLLSGGVSANKKLREMIAEKIAKGFYFDMKGRKIDLNLKPKFNFPHNISYCTDNAAMIAGVAYFQHQFKKSNQKSQNFQNIFHLADPNLNLYQI